jgi:hypothetical protein
MYIRVRKDGFIYDYNDILARNPECEVVPEEIAYPERFVTPEVVEAVKVSRTRRKSALDLTTADIPEPPVYTPPELAADASRGLPE